MAVSASRTTPRTKPSPSPATFPAKKTTAVKQFLHCLSLSAIVTLILLLHSQNPNPDPKYSEFETLDPAIFSRSSVVVFASAGNGSSVGESPATELWRQPEKEGYVPCLEFGIGYRRASSEKVLMSSGEKKRFLVAVVTGGLNQQRNQIADAVVIARILEAVLVVPILQVNPVWNDESEFSDIFDVEHFKETLKNDIRIVSSIPSAHFSGRHKVESKLPRDLTPQWIHSRFYNQLNQDGLIVLKGLDSKLAKNLPPDLQKLKCKVAFRALRFAEPIRALGERLAKRMWIEGPYIAVHLRLEKDVWVRTGCRTGLGPEYDAVIAKAREAQPELLTSTLNMTYSQRRLAGLCPLNAAEFARLLKGLGAERRTHIYIAGGEPFGGEKALSALSAEFPNISTKESLAKPGELSNLSKSPSALAGLDYVVSLSSDVFVPSHGGNMGRALMGHRAFLGHRKSIRPNKRLLVPLLEDSSIPEDRLGDLIKEIHGKSMGAPEHRGFRRDRDVIAYPVPECMCQKSNTRFFRR